MRLKAQEILGRYVEPGTRNCENTINQLMDVLDDSKLIEAVDKVKHGQSEQERVSGPQRINMHEDFEVKYWIKELGVTEERLQKAVDKVGNSAAAVRMELGA